MSNFITDEIKIYSDEEYSDGSDKKILMILMNLTKKILMKKFECRKLNWFNRIKLGFASSLLTYKKFYQS